VPISHALGWPARIDSPASRLDFTALSPLTFERPDSGRFPSLRLAREALALGGLASVVLNAANEVAVAAFLARRIGFLGIARTVEDVLAANERDGAPLESLQQVRAADLEARRKAEEVVRKHALTN
jgi:1-deoxy-D-xylulose-5-phosphate reductoisomerase